MRMHEQGGYVIGAGVHIYYIGIRICFWTKKKESYVSDRLSFSKTLRQIYRLALPLGAPETLSS